MLTFKNTAPSPERGTVSRGRVVQQLSSRLNASNTSMECLKYPPATYIIRGVLGRLSVTTGFLCNVRSCIEKKSSYACVQSCFCSIN